MPISLSDLPLEVIDNIVSIVDASSLKSICALALVSKSWHNIVTPYLYGELATDVITGEGALMLSQTLQKRPELYGHVKRAVLEFPFVALVDDDDDVDEQVGMWEDFLDTWLNMLSLCPEINDLSFNLDPDWFGLAVGQEGAALRLVLKMLDFRCLPNLQMLHISVGLHLESTVATQLLSVAERCPNLLELAVSVDQNTFTFETNATPDPVTNISVSTRPLSNLINGIHKIGDLRLYRVVLDRDPPLSKKFALPTNDLYGQVHYLCICLHNACDVDARLLPIFTNLQSLRLTFDQRCFGHSAPSIFRDIFSVCHPTVTALHLVTYEPVNWLTEAALSPALFKSSFPAVDFLTVTWRLEEDSAAFPAMKVLRKGFSDFRQFLRKFKHSVEDIWLVLRKENCPDDELAIVTWEKQTFFRDDPDEDENRILRDNWGSRVIEAAEYGLRM